MTSVTNSLNHKSHQVVIIVLIVIVLVLSLCSCWSPQLSLPLRSIVRKVKSVLGNSEVPDGYVGLGHLLSCHCIGRLRIHIDTGHHVCVRIIKKPFPKDHGSSVSKAKASILQQERYKKKVRHRIEK